MPEPKGDRLYVALGAAEVRRRLEGFGHGVRKVQSAGRKQAVIIHTATGRHLEELRAKFADVGCARRQADLGESIESLLNLGPASCRWLRNAGITTIDALRQIGAVAAFRIVRQAEPSASLNLLWALAAGLAGRDWRTLTDEEKERLKEEAFAEE